MKRAAIATFAVLIPFMHGCGGAGMVSKARGGLSVAAVAGTQADNVIASAYSQRSAAVQARVDSFEDYETAMRAMSEAVAAVGILRISLLAAESALDAYEAGHGSAADFVASVGCVARAVQRVTLAFDAAGVRIPASIAKASHALKGAPACEVAE